MDRINELLGRWKNTKGCFYQISEILRFVRLKKERSINLYLKREVKKQKLEFLTKFKLKDETLKSFVEELKRTTKKDFELIDPDEIEILHYVWKKIFVGKVNTDTFLKNYTLNRDKERCKYCGDKEKLEIHHLVPKALGGKANVENLVVACKKCNDLIGGTIQVPLRWGIKINEKTSF